MKRATLRIKPKNSTTKQSAKCVIVSTCRSLTTHLADIPFFKPADDAPEMKYLHERRAALGGYLPQRRMQADEKLPVPELAAFKAVLDPTAEGREISTTQAYVRIMSILLRDANLGQRLVPIMVDESRTFGMEGLFRQIGIFNQ